MRLGRWALKEVHHRVKNNLQVVSSLVSLQAEHVDDLPLRGLFEDVRDRVRAMAMVHEKLYQSGDLSSVDFAGYPRSLLDQLWRGQSAVGSEVRLKLNLEPVALPVDVAVPCGLILSELVSNALHHAFRGRSGGEVTVGLQNRLDDQVCLWVADDGVGLPASFELSAAVTLGLQLVQLLVQQLCGVVEVRAGAGTEFRVTFPQSKSAPGTPTNNDLETQPAPS